MFCRCESDGASGDASRIAISTDELHYACNNHTLHLPSSEPDIQSSTCCHLFGVLISAVC